MRRLTGMGQASHALFTARVLVDELVLGGVRVACVAPGSRSTPLALAIAERRDLASHVLTDERSMGFFALGIARATGSPVALACTSGTAVANLLPALVEADLGGGALVALTADRPPELRDCASPQTIAQVGIFGAHARWAVDVPLLEAGESSARVLRSLAARAVATAMRDGGGAVQLNVPFREPFFDDSFPKDGGLDTAARFRDARDAADGEDGPARGGAPFTRSLEASGFADADATVRDLARRLASARRGVLVCAGREVPAREVTALARALGWPIVADPLCGLRFRDGDDDGAVVIDAAEPLLRDEELRAALAPDALLRFGLTPAPRSVQRWLDAAWPAVHVVVAGHGWPDPVHAASDLVRAPAAALCATLLRALDGHRPGEDTLAWTSSWQRTATAARASLDAGLGDATAAPLFDGAVLDALVDALPDGSALVVGNSMPVRDFDTFAGSRPKHLRAFANRGASGIDGVVSTAMGIAAARRTEGDARGTSGPTALVLGDLSFLHDATALAFAARERLPLLVVVVNNDGGGIFSHLPQRGLGEAFERFFGTPHGVDLASVCALPPSRFRRVATAGDLDAALHKGVADAMDGPVVVEVRTDRERGREAHLALVDAARRAARAAFDPTPRSSR